MSPPCTPRRIYAHATCINEHHACSKEQKQFFPSPEKPLSKPSYPLNGHQATPIAHATNRCFPNPSGHGPMAVRVRQRPSG
uniref:Uncharacterized protein n=1 Tax=Panagrellus redivivus TaxID=6233 RepID=A0A7E4VGG2_PANRE